MNTDWFGGQYLMKISTKGRYAIRLMLDIAQNSNGGNVSIKDVAQRQDISLKYLEQIVNMLSKAGFLHSQRGSQGGYRLTRLPGEYTVGDILRVTEGELAPVACLADEPNKCPKAASCPTVRFWTGLYDVVSNYLDGTTLNDLIEKPAESNENFCCYI